MNYQELSPQGETLLKEIIGLQTSGKDNTAHWNERFQNLSFQEENLLRDYIDTAIKILIAVVLGALLLAGLYTLFGDTVLPTVTERVEEMFDYNG